MPNYVFPSPSEVISSAYFPSCLPMFIPTVAWISHYETIATSE